jgi:hypothetical protein
MSVHVSILGVLVAAVSAMIVGYVWYSPALFGRQWMKIIGVSDKDMKRDMPQAMPLLVVASLLTAYVLARFTVLTHSYHGGSWVVAGLDTALWAWVGLAATTVVAHGVFDPRSKKAFYINIGNRFVTLILMGLIIGLFMK